MIVQDDLNLVKPTLESGLYTEVLVCESCGVTKDHVEKHVIDENVTCCLCEDCWADAQESIYNDSADGIEGTDYFADGSKIIPELTANG